MNTNIKFMVVMGKLNKTIFNTLGKNLESLNLHPTAYLILAHLNKVKREKTQKLGTVAVITSGTITHMVNKLVKCGYVTKIQEKNDKRIIWVEITPLGEAKFIEVNNEHMKYLDRLLSYFTEEEKLNLIEQIKYFGKKLDSKG